MYVHLSTLKCQLVRCLCTLVYLCVCRFSYEGRETINKISANPHHKLLSHERRTLVIVI